MKYLVVFSLGITFQMIVKIPSDYWYIKTYNLSKGDKVKLHMPEKFKTFYKGCDATFIASQNINDGEIAFIKLENCESDSLKGITVDMISSSALEKVNY